MDPRTTPGDDLDIEDQNARDTAIDFSCRAEALETTNFLFRDHDGADFALFGNNSMLFTYQSELAYADGCTDRCLSCRARASYKQRVRNSNGHFMTVPGSGQDAFFFFFFALFLGCLFASSWRWVGPRIRKFTKWLSWIPYTIVVMFSGGACHLVAHYLNLGKISNSFHWWMQVNPPELLFYALLPVLLFDAAMRVQWFYFRKTFIAIMIFAFVLVVLNTLLTGLFMQYAVIKLAILIGVPLKSWELMNGFTFGAILGSTDPVAVISFMEENNAPPIISTIIGGESLFNDASAYIIFADFLMNSLSGYPTKTASSIVASMFYAGGVGMLVGAFCGIILVIIIRSLNEQPVVETNFTLAFAYGSFYAAQGLLNASGPVSVVTTGLFMASFGLASVSPKAREHLLSFWEIVVFIANTVIFFFTGVLAISLFVTEAATDGTQVRLSVSAGKWAGSILMGLPLIYLSQYFLRGLWILILYPFLSRGLGFHRDKVNWGTAIFLNFSALRGGVNLIMVLIVAQMPDDELRPQVKFFLTIYATGFVLMTLFINAPLIPVMMKATGLSGGSTLSKVMMDKARRSLRSFCHSAMLKLETDRYLISADMSQILKIVEEIVGRDEAMEREREAREADHIRVRGMRNEDGSPSTTWFYTDPQQRTATGLSEEDALSFIGRKSYEFRQKIPKLQPMDPLFEYTHLVTNVRAAGINTLASAMLDSTLYRHTDILCCSDDEDAREKDSGIYSARLPAWRGRSHTGKEAPSAGASDGDDSLVGGVEREELRVKVLASLQRKFRRERINGKISPSELSWLQEACDGASHNASSSPVSLWKKLSYDLYVLPLEKRQKKFWPLRKFLDDRIVLAVACAFTIHESLMAASKHEWIRQTEWLEREIGEEITLIDAFLGQLRLDEPDLIQEVQTSRGMRIMGNLIRGFVEDSLIHEGIITAQQAERLIGNKHAVHTKRTKREIIQNLSFCQVLNSREFEQLWGTIHFYSVERGSHICAKEGLHIVLSGVAVRVTDCTGAGNVLSRIRSLLGSGALLGALDAPLQDIYAHSSVVHLALIPMAALSETCLGKESRRELMRCKAACVLDTWLRHTLAAEASSSSGEEDAPEESPVDLAVSNLSQVGRVSTLQRGISDKVLDRLDRESQMAGLRQSVQILEDIKETLKEGQLNKEARMRKLCMHLLAHLDHTDLVKLQEGDSIIQQGHLVLLQGHVESKKQRREIYTNTAVIEHTNERKLVATEKTVIISFHPAI